MIQQKTLLNILIPVLYTVAILVVVLYQWNKQIIIHQGGSSPLFQNLMAYPAYVKNGFDLAEIQQIHPEIAFEQINNGEWLQFKSPQLRIMNSPLPSLPKRTFLSPWGRMPQELTIIIPIEINDIHAYSSAIPGIFLGYIGENWEIFLNGELIKSEIHLNRPQTTNDSLEDIWQIKSRRNWRDVYFPFDRSLLIPGINILAFRILGDPTLGVTGFYYSAPYYIDDFRHIEGRNRNILMMILCGIFGYTGIYYLIIFLSVRKKEDIYNLYYSIFSFLLCVYTLMRNGIVNSIIPNSDISIRLEFASLFMMISMFGIFIEKIGRGKITKISRGFLVFYVILSLTQALFCTQYGAEVLMIWGASVFIYLSYVFIYDIIYFYFWEQGRDNFSDAFILNTLISSVLVYFCTAFDILDSMFFHNAFNLSLYSTCVFHIGMAINLSQRFRGMYSRLEQSNAMVLELQNALIKTIAELVEFRDNITGSHIERTQRGIKIITEELEKSGVYKEETKDWDLNLLHQSSQLHDVGKISINDNILGKPGKLNDEEFDIMKRHTSFGEEIIDRIKTLARESDFLKYAKIFAGSHHEKWDGTGYPRMLKESEIPLMGRIMAIVDVYDALTSERPYKKAFTHDEAVQIIVEGSGKQFEPALVEVFLRTAERFRQ